MPSISSAGSAAVVAQARLSPSSIMPSRRQVSACEPRRRNATTKNNEAKGQTMISMMQRAGVAKQETTSQTRKAKASNNTPTDKAALKTAAMQQELMVAAFSCHDID